MSGPKVSVYELSATEKKRYYEQLEILKQTEICMQKIIRSMGILECEIDKVSGLAGNGQSRCVALGSEDAFLLIIQKVNEIKRILKEISEENERIKTAYRRDKEGFVKLSAEMDRERAGKLKSLQELCKKLEEEIRETKNLKEETLAEIEKVDENLRNELHSQVLGGFSIDFSTIKRKQESKKIDEIKPDDAEILKVQEERKIEYTKKINNALETVSALLGTDERLSPALKAKRDQVRQLATEIASVDFLENFYAITVTPFVKECKEYAKLLESFDEVNDRYCFLCEEAGLVATKYEPTVENIEIIKRQIETLESEDAESKVREYINDALEEAMEEMGYGLVGSRTATKKTGRKVKHELYHFGEGTGVDITYGDDGQITMELGGFDECDRTPNEGEAAKLTEDMHRFCGEYAALERILEKKGVQRRNISLMLPSPEFAQIFNTEDYEMSKPVQKFEVKKEKKAVQQARHAE